MDEPLAPPPNGEPLPFRTLDELLRDAPEPAFLWEDWLARGAKHLLPGRPKTGKSTFAWCLGAALTNGEEEFLGQPVTTAGVLYLSEETAPDAFRTKMLRAGLLGDDPLFRVLRRVDVVGRTWPEVVAGIGEAAATLRDKSGVPDVLVVVENLSKWARFGEGQENDSAVTEQSIDELDPVTGAGFTVLIISHAGWLADRTRGSSAIEGAVDALWFLDGRGAGRTLTHRGGRLGVDPDPLGFCLSPEVGLELLGRGRPSTVSKLAEVLHVVESLTNPTAADIANELGWTVRTTQRWLAVLEARLKVYRREEQRGGPGGGSAVTWHRGIDWQRIKASVASHVASLPDVDGPK